MALVRFIFPFTSIVGEKQINISAGDVGELCSILIERYGPEMNVLLDKDREVSKNIVILVNRRNVHTTKGARTILDDDAEVLIMPHIIGG